MTNLDTAAAELAELLAKLNQFSIGHAFKYGHGGICGEAEAAISKLLTDRAQMKAELAELRKAVTPVKDDQDQALADAVRDAMKRLCGDEIDMELELAAQHIECGRLVTCDPFIYQIEHSEMKARIAALEGENERLRKPLFGLLTIADAPADMPNGPINPGDLARKGVAKLAFGLMELLPEIRQALASPTIPHQTPSPIGLTGSLMESPMTAADIAKGLTLKQREALINSRRLIIDGYPSVPTEPSWQPWPDGVIYYDWSMSGALSELGLQVRAILEGEKA